MIGELGKAARGNPVPPFPLAARQKAGHGCMGSDNLPENLRSAEAILRQAGEMFERLALDLGRAVGRVAEGELAASKEASQVARELRDTFRTVLSERERVDKLRSQVAGVVGDASGTGTLDFDAARDEVCRRLARLRDAGSG